MLNDVCEKGLCWGELLDCDDGNVCIDDVCYVIQGCIYYYGEVPCDDGNFCIVDD